MEGVYKSNIAASQQKMKKRARTAEQAMGQALDKAAQSMLQTAHELSSGPGYDKKKRPYARRAPSPPQPAYILNRGRGTVFAGWNVSITRGASPSITLRNNAAHFRFFAGTKSMIERPIAKEIEKREKRKFKVSMAGVQRSVLRG